MITCPVLLKKLLHEWLGMMKLLVGQGQDRIFFLTHMYLQTELLREFNHSFLQHRLRFVTLTGLKRVFKRRLNTDSSQKTPLSVSWWPGLWLAASYILTDWMLLGGIPQMVRLSTHYLLERCRYSTAVLFCQDYNVLNSKLQLTDMFILFWSAGASVDSRSFIKDFSLFG